MKLALCIVSVALLCSLFFNVLFYLALRAPDWSHYEGRPLQEPQKPARHLTLVKG